MFNKYPRYIPEMLHVFAVSLVVCLHHVELHYPFVLPVYVCHHVIIAIKNNFKSRILHFHYNLKLVNIYIWSVIFSDIFPTCGWCFIITFIMIFMFMWRFHVFNIKKKNNISIFLFIGLKANIFMDCNASQHTFPNSVVNSA